MKATAQHKNRAAGRSWQQGQWENRPELQQEYQDYGKGKWGYGGLMCWCTNTAFMQGNSGATCLAAAQQQE